MHVQSVAPRGAIGPACPSEGLALCPEERKTEGIIAGLSVRENVMLALQARSGFRFALSLERQGALARAYVELLGIKQRHALRLLGCCDWNCCWQRSRMRRRDLRPNPGWLIS